MSLKERAAKASSTKHKGGFPCNVQKALPTLDQEDGDALLELIYDRLDLDAEDVEVLLAEEDIDISAWVVRRHRRGGCRTCKKG